jgi:hypothetical protein
MFNFLIKIILNKITATKLETLKLLQYPRTLDESCDLNTI